MADVNRARGSAVFGASGTLGSAIAARLEDSGDVARMTRSRTPDERWICTSDSGWEGTFGQLPLERVVWAQGANAKGAIGNTPASELERLFEANVTYIVETLDALLAVGAVGSGSSLCIVSSVWQLVARDSKLAYVTTKTAVGGLVRSLAADLGPRGIRVNAILPGVVQSPMTATFLEEESIQRVERETPMRQLVDVAEVAEVAWWLTGPGSRGVQGQSIAVDNGWSVVRSV